MLKIRKRKEEKKENRVAVRNMFLRGNDFGVLGNGSSECWFGLKNCHHQQTILLIPSLSHRTASQNQPEATK